jgi:hypothetical protein
MANTEQGGSPERTAKAEDSACGISPTLLVATDCLGAIDGARAILNV